MLFLAMINRLIFRFSVTRSAFYGSCSIAALSLSIPGLSPHQRYFIFYISIPANHAYHLGSMAEQVLLIQGEALGRLYEHRSWYEHSGGCEGQEGK